MPSNERTGPLSGLTPGGGKARARAIIRFAFAYIEQATVLKVALDELLQVRRWFDTLEARDSIARGRAKVAHAKIEPADAGD